MALFVALGLAVKKEPNLLKGKTLAQVSYQKVVEILKGKRPIPLLRERWECLKELGEILENKFAGDFLNVFFAAKNDALRLTQLLVDNFPNFNDVSLGRGKKIAFYTRD